MSQNEKQRWLHLYRTVKLDIDKYMSEHPSALRNILNLKKMLHASAFQRTMEQIIDRGHPTIQTQIIGPLTSRKSLLSRLRNWYRESFHMSRAPLLHPSRQFEEEAKFFFQNRDHYQDVFYGSLFHTTTNRLYHFFVVKTTAVQSNIPGYLSYTVYLIVVVDDETVQVYPLS